MSKKGFIRTLEAVLAILFSAIIVVGVMPSIVKMTSSFNQEVSFTQSILNNDEIRDCVLSENTTCVRSNLDDLILKDYNYDFLISQDYRSSISDLPVKRISVEAIVFAGNVSLYDPKILKIYYWR